MGNAVSSWVGPQLTRKQSTALGLVRCSSCKELQSATKQTLSAFRLSLSLRVSLLRAKCIQQHRPEASVLSLALGSGRTDVLHLHNLHLNARFMSESTSLLAEMQFVWEGRGHCMEKQGWLSRFISTLVSLGVPDLSASYFLSR